MKAIKILLPFLVVIITSLFGMAQTNPVLDGAYIREHVTERKPVPYPYIREADAMWSKKILRVIQLDEKINHPMYFPITRITYPAGLQPQRHRINLLSLINNIGILGQRFDAAGNQIVLEPGEEPDYSNRLPVYKLFPGDITSWNKMELAKDDPARDSLFGYETTITQLVDPNDESLGSYDRTIRAPMDDTRPMTKLWMWEEWIFDRNRSVMDVRIISMSFDGYAEGDKRVWPFWIYFPDYRPLLATNETFNAFNDSENRSYDDIFLKRHFTSYVVAESNVYDNRLISDYMLGIDAIREGEAIQERIFMFEHDQFEY